MAAESLMSGRVAGVFHIHTRHSFDCMTSPAKIVKWAEKHAVDVLGITDHNTIRGAQEAAFHATGSGVQVIIGAEYATNHGDVIGLFLEEEICSRDAFDVINAIKEQGGISILPHPFHGHSLTEKLAKAVDMVEVFNTRCSENQNRHAFELARSCHKPMIGGADAHFLRDIGNCVCYLEAGPMLTPETILQAHMTWIGKHSLKTGLHWSQAIKGWKTRDSPLLRSHLRAVVLSHIRNAVGLSVYEKMRDVWKKWRSCSNY